MALKKKGLVKTNMKHTNTISDTLLRLPIYYKLKELDVRKICENIKFFINK